MIRWYGRFRSGLESFSQYRALKRRLFSGNPVLMEIGRHESHGRVSLSLLYRNGLVLTLGEKGILDFQDHAFAHYLGGSAGDPGVPAGDLGVPAGDLGVPAGDLGVPAGGNRAGMIHLHKLVLKSLIRYMVHPGVDLVQRERAAEAASKLYLAEVEATTDWLPGPAAAVVRESFEEETLVRP